MTNTTDKEKRSPDKPLSDHALSVIAEQGLTDLYRRLATELLAHRAAERKRSEAAHVEQEGERVSLEVDLSGMLDDQWLKKWAEWCPGSAPLTTIGSKTLADLSHELLAHRARVRFAFAHLPAEDKMTETAEPLVEHHATVAVSTKQLTDDARQRYKLRETLLTLVKTSSERDTVRRAALALIEGS